MILLESLLTILTLGGARSQWDLDLQAYWSMDNYDSNAIYPEHSVGESEWDIDISSFDTDEVISPGINQTALFSKRESIDLKRNIKRICVHDLSYCEVGLSIIFWIKIDRLIENEFQAILLTTDSLKRLPGIYIGASENNDDIDIFMWDGSRGMKYKAAFHSSLLGTVWTHLGVVWSADTGIKVAINGTWLNEDDFSVPPLEESVATKPVPLTDLTVGNDAGLEFHLDEFLIYYRNVSIDEFRWLYEAQVSGETTTTSVTGMETSLATTTTTTTTTTTKATATPTIAAATTQGNTAAVTTSATATIIASTTSRLTPTNAEATTTTARTSTIAAATTAQESTAMVTTSGTAATRTAAATTTPRDITTSVPPPTTTATRKMTTAAGQISITTTTVTRTETLTTTKTTTTTTDEGLPVWIPLTVGGTIVVMVIVFSVCFALCCWMKRKRNNLA